MPIPMSRQNLVSGFRGTTSCRATATFSPDSRWIAVAHAEGEFVICDLTTGLHRVRRRGPMHIEKLQFSPDGSRIALIEHDGEKRTYRIIDGQTGMPIRSFEARPGADMPAWSPDGTILATPCGGDHKIDLWDAATGTRRATLEGHINGGLWATFLPAGTLLASNGWEGRLWLWDPVLGRPWLTLTGRSSSDFSRDGRIVVSRENTFTTYQVDPALEYRTFAHVSSKLTGCYTPSIRCDVRVLAVGTKHGVLLWDLARGTELAFLPIGLAWHLRFEPSGDLLTSGSLGVRRWPIRLDCDRGECRIGPPRPLPLPPGDCDIAADRSGRIVALAHYDLVFVATSDRTIPVGPLDDCRSVAVSPDGEWLATGTHDPGRGAQVWRIADLTKVVELSLDYPTVVAFSPDGKWLMTGNLPCRLWEVGTWREAPLKIGGEGKCFSPDGRLVVVQDASRIIRLVEIETGRTLARLESPDLCSVAATFSPDGSRLVVTTHDGPAVHVWDLRAIRRQLARIGLDWDAPAYSDDDLASPTLPPLPPLQVDLGPSPLTWQPEPQFSEHLIADLETALARQPAQRRIRGLLAHYCNDYAWALANGLESTRDPQHARALARRAVELAPQAGIALTTLGAAQYRADRYAEAVATLEQSLKAGRGQSDALSLFFLALARFKLGEIAQARADFDRAVKWRRDHLDLTQPESSDELDAFQAEARALLDGSPAELPADVFAPEPPNRP
jgi:WD40 repeat protein